MKRADVPQMSASLPVVEAPTLLIVGELDLPVIKLNERARAQMRTYVRMVIVPGATHLFGEPGAMDEVARLARDWFLERLGAPAARTSAAAHNH